MLRKAAAQNVSARVMPTTFFQWRADNRRRSNSSSNISSRYTSSKQVNRQCCCGAS